VDVTHGYVAATVRPRRPRSYSARLVTQRPFLEQLSQSLERLFLPGAKEPLPVIPLLFQ
jgi:hypothetical protein